MSQTILKFENEKTNHNVLSVSSVTKIFDKKNGIFDINFSVKKGAFHVLVGPNGAGKSTLMKTILNIYQQFTGEIIVNGVSNHKTGAFLKVSYIGDNPKFSNEFNLKDFLIWNGRLSGKSVRHCEAKIVELANRYKLTAFLSKNPNKLSLGQKQKIMLVKVLIEDPDLIILDEPTANVDLTNKTIFYEEIKKLNKDGKTILICTHNYEEIEEMATWLTILKDGRIIHDSEKNVEKSFKEIVKGHISYD